MHTSQQLYKRGVLFLTLLYFLLMIVSCSNAKPAELWESLPALETDPSAHDLQPVWINQGAQDASIKIMVFIEPFCRSNTCLQYNSTVLPFLHSQEDVYIEIYDYPLSQEAKSFMLSAAGMCIAQENMALYLDFLERAAKISDRYDNNLEIQLLANELVGEYDRTCVRNQVREIKSLFENQNPLELQEVPATVIAGKIMYGNVSTDQIQSVLTSIKK